MAAPFLPQAQIQAPRNALLDFSPINDAIDGNRRNALMSAQMDMQREQLGMQRQTHDLNVRRLERDERTGQIESLGRRAQAIDALPKGDPRRAQAWKGVLASHPNAGSLGPEWQDPNLGPSMLAAEAGKWMDPQQRALLQAQTAQAQAGVANIPLQQELLRAQVEQAKRKDETAALNAEIMRQIFPGLGAPPTAAPPAAGAPAAPSAPAPQGQPQAPGGATLQRMGDTGQPPADPMLHQAQAVTPQQAPAAPRSAIESLTPEQRQAMGLALIGKGDAGKILMDAASANKLDKEARNRVEGQMVDGFNQLGRLASIQQQFKPEYLMIDKRAGFAWNSLMDSTSMTRKSLKPEQRAQLADYAAFRQEATENLNRYIKEITGAQMSEAEAARLTRAMPNPGTGIFDGDSPTEFKAKMDNAVRMSQLAFARNSFLRKQGFQGNAEQAASQIPLHRMEGIIQQRAQSLLQETQQSNPGVPPAELMPLVRQRLRSDFGIGA